MTAYRPVVFVEDRNLKSMNKKLFLFFFLVWTTCLFGSAVEERMKQISLNDRICMKEFFDQAIRHDQTAHVLYFKNKPVCLTYISLKYQDKNFKDILALRGWRAFKKHEHLFPHPNFMFNENLFESGDDCKLLHIYAINKKSLIKCLDEHCILFKKILGQEFSSENFIKKLEEGQPLLALLSGDEELLGVLLGYGEESAHAFKKVRPRCTTTFAPPPTDTYCRIALSCPKGCKISPVVFMGNPHSPEVQQLSSMYEKELEAVWAEYKQLKDPLKMILEKLCEE